MTFQIGENVVYPNHGVATIENISSRIFAGHSERFYLLRLKYNSLTVMVPFSHVGDLGLRKVTRNGEVARVVSFLSEGRCRAHRLEGSLQGKHRKDARRKPAGRRRGDEEPSDSADA